MRDQTTLRHLFEYFLSFGAYDGEPVHQRGRRRIFVGYAWVGSVITLGPAIGDYAAGLPLVGLLNAMVPAVAIPALFLIKVKPERFGTITNITLMIVFVIQLAITAVLGGLWPSGLTVLFGLVIVLAAAIGLTPRATAWWFAAFLASLIYAAIIPTWVDPIYIVEDPTMDAVVNIAVTASLALAVVLYFARQRDRFQKESDDLLHNILPDDIANRLKADDGMIADHFDEATVLFADIADFTPLSANMTPAELVDLLNGLFSVFDRFVVELGIEKIKTAGDEYMVAAGVPRPRPDHAHAAAELALRMRDHVAGNQIDGHKIRMRIGMHSGPLVAGIIGTGKFSYDLWGDTVNTASRMESSGKIGSIQVTGATYELLRDDFVFVSRGAVAVKGKGQLQTYLLESRA
jgi:guanylate cyclase